MRIRWTSPAVSDLTGIYDDLETYETRELAQRIAEAIYGAAESLRLFPKKGRIGREPDTRELVIQRYCPLSFTSYIPTASTYCASCMDRSNGPA
jgi:plasmid stabilization system protein ParE